MPSSATTEWRRLNPEKALAASRAYYARTKEQRNKYQREHKAMRYALIGDIKLERGCHLCGYNEYAEALDFHHRDPEQKKFNISQGVMGNMELLLAEIAKCDLLCANCHRVFHAGHEPGRT